ncbi:MAG: hypothetical protein ABFR75_08900 [Acidobacteriota bacterium]
MNDGVEGTPEAGIYNYKEFETVSYNYNSIDENIQIEVLLNGNARTQEGTITMYNHLEIIVRIIDIRDTWEFEYNKEDGTSGTFDVTFAGNTPFEGTFSDSRGYTGTWKVENNDLTITFSNWSDYVFTGTLSSMAGNYTGENIEGTWNASRKN